MAKEIEAKYLSIDPMSLRDQLTTLGATLVHPEFLMHRITYTLTDIQKTLRVRSEWGKVTMTYKHSRPDLGVYGLDEHEIIISSFDEAVVMLDATLNYHTRSSQESTRELWRIGESEICIDTWPGIPTYLEIESPSEEELIFLSKQLGYNYSQAIFGRVGAVYEAYGWRVEDLNAITELSFSFPPSVPELKDL